MLPRSIAAASDLGRLFSPLRGWLDSPARVFGLGGCIPQTFVVTDVAIASDDLTSIGVSLGKEIYAKKLVRSPEHRLASRCRVASPKLGRTLREPLAIIAL